MGRRPGIPTDPKAVGYDLKRLTIDRLSGETRLSLMTKDGSKDRKPISSGRCVDQHPRF